MDLDQGETSDSAGNVDSSSLRRPPKAIKSEVSAQEEVPCPSPETPRPNLSLSHVVPHPKGRRLKAHGALNGGAWLRQNHVKIKWRFSGDGSDPRQKRKSLSEDPLGSNAFHIFE